MFKFDCFSHEKEVRLFVSVFEKFEDEISVSYRSNADYVIPYLELDFDKDSVSQITLGPSPGDKQQKKMQQAVVQEMLKGRGYRASAPLSITRSSSKVSTEAGGSVSSSTPK